MENKEKLIVTDGILYKIKMFFRKIFVKEEKVENKIENNNIQETKKDFKDEIAIKRDEEKERLLKLQEKIRNKEIQEEDISEENIEKLNRLYDEQIANLREKIKQNIETTERYKKEIVELKSKI